MMKESKEILEFLDGIEDRIDINIMWDKTIDRYVKSITKAKLIMNLLINAQIQNFI